MVSQQQLRYSDANIWQDDFEPVIQFTNAIYQVKIPGKDFYNKVNSFVVSVDKYGFIDFKSCNWFGITDVSRARAHLIQYLTEWELAEYVRISDEDMELIATTKLCSLFGMER